MAVPCEEAKWATLSEVVTYFSCIQSFDRGRMTHLGPRESDATDLLTTQ